MQAKLGTKCTKCTTYISWQLAHAVTISYTMYHDVTGLLMLSHALSLEVFCDASRTVGLDSTLTISDDLRWLLLLWRQLWTGHQDPEWNPDTEEALSRSTRGAVGAVWLFKIHFQHLPASRSRCGLCCPQGGPWCLQSPNLQWRLGGVWSQDKVMSTHKSSIIHPQGHWNILKHIDMFGPWLRTSVPFTDLTT